MSVIASGADIVGPPRHVSNVPITEVPAKKVAMETGSTGLGLRGKEFASFGFLAVTVAAFCYWVGG
jgi:hypothetical protein